MPTFTEHYKYISDIVRYFTKNQTSEHTTRYISEIQKTISFYADKYKTIIDHIQTSGLPLPYVWYELANSIFKTCSWINLIVVHGLAIVIVQQILHTEQDIIEFLTHVARYTFIRAGWWLEEQGGWEMFNIAESSLKWYHRLLPFQNFVRKTK